jgi:hypothetical protein
MQSSNDVENARWLVAGYGIQTIASARAPPSR